jgi:protein-tyrosine phosphatase
MKKFKVLFVCLGNICRSPAAEGVLLHLVKASGLQDRVEVDSAGTGDWHAGDLPDHRMRQHAMRRGYPLISRARQVQHVTRPGTAPRTRSRSRSRTPPRRGRNR